MRCSTLACLLFLTLTCCKSFTSYWNKTIIFPSAANIADYFKKNTPENTSHDTTIFVLVLFLPLSGSPWETNDVLSCFSSPCSQTDKVEAYNAGKLMSMQMTRDKERETKGEKWKQKGSSGEWYVSFGDVIHASVQGDSGSGNSLSQRMTSTLQAVRQVVKGLSPTLPLSSG